MNTVNIEKDIKRHTEALEKLKELAKAKGLQDNVLFTSTVDIYDTQLKILEALAKEIEENGPTVSREYVKGRVNIVINPAIQMYNNTSNSISKTTATITSIIKNFEKDTREAKDPLLAIMGMDDD